MNVISQLGNKKFNNINLPSRLRSNIKKLIGPITNLQNVKTIHKQNFRLFIDEKNFKYRILNTHFQKKSFHYDLLLKAFLRVYSDGIFTSVYILKLKKRIKFSILIRKTTILKMIVTSWVLKKIFFQNFQKE